MNPEKTNPEGAPFTRRLYAGWADMDFNAHMKNTAYLDKCSDVRLMFFGENGFPAQEFARLGFGPVVMKDEVEYYREVRLMQSIEVSLAVAGLSADGSRFILRNDFRRGDGKACVKVTSTGGWLDLELTGPCPGSYRMRVPSFARGEIFPVLVPVSPADDTPVTARLALRAWPAATGSVPVATVHGLQRSLSW